MEEQAQSFILYQIDPFTLMFLVIFPATNPHKKAVNKKYMVIVLLVSLVLAVFNTSTDAMSLSSSFFPFPLPQNSTLLSTSRVGINAERLA
jgi:uncharacterized membrane protein YwaF